MKHMYGATNMFKPSLSPWGIVIIVGSVLNFLGIGHAEPREVAINSDSSAIMVANNLTGLTRAFDGKHRSLYALASKASRLIDTTTPFIGDSFDGRAAWIVSYPEVLLEYANDSMEKPIRSNKECTVWIDSLSGQFLRAEIHNLDDDATIHHRLPSLEESERQLSMFREVYVGIPSQQPVINLLEAIEASGHLAVQAREITVQYIMYSRQGHEPVPAWVLYMRGLPPLPISQPVPLPVATTQRVVVNALTGEVFPISNLPVPENID